MRKHWTKLVFLCVGFVLACNPSVPAEIKREQKSVVVLYAVRREAPAAVATERVLQSVLTEGLAGHLDYYTEYLDVARFPNAEYQAALHQFLLRKYKDQRIDVVIGTSDAVSAFAAKYRSDLFPGAASVFVSQKVAVPLPNSTTISAPMNMSGTIKLALKLQPDTARVFVVSGDTDYDKYYEAVARQQLPEFENQVGFTYLTGLPITELLHTVAHLPEHSIIYFLSMVGDSNENRFLSVNVLDRVAPVANVPIYGWNYPELDHGLVGGYLRNAEISANKIAEIALRLLRGEKPENIPSVEVNPYVIAIDWRQLRRWGIGESRLPPEAMVRFRELTLWEQYKWRIIGVLVLCAAQALLIMALLFQRNQSARSERLRRSSEERFSKAFRSSPDAFVLVRSSDDTIIEVNDHWEAVLGHGRDEVVGRTLIDLNVCVNPQDCKEFFRLIEGAGLVRDFETDVRSKNGDIHRLVLSAESIFINEEPCLLIIMRDITQRMKSEQTLQELTGRLIHLQDEERRRVASELHDGLGQSLAIIRNRAAICQRDISDAERVSEQLQEISATAASAIEEVREIAHNLRPYELDRLGLVEAVQSMVGKVCDTTSIRLSSDLDRIDGLLSPAAETSIYRIVQEGLNNVVKHAEATEARVGIKRSVGEVLVFVEDNGRGIDRRTKTENGKNGSGFGLTGIAERARLLGGVCAIDSEPGRGTTLTVRLDLPDKSHEQ